MKSLIVFAMCVCFFGCRIPHAKVNVGLVEKPSDVQSVDAEKIVNKTWTVIDTTSTQDGIFAAVLINNDGDQIEVGLRKTHQQFEAFSSLREGDMIMFHLIPKNSPNVDVRDSDARRLMFEIKKASH